MSETGARGIRWRSPQVLLSLFALVVAAVYAARSGPPSVPPAPTLAVEAAEAGETPLEEAVLYAVDDDGLARPIVRDLPASEDASERLQARVDALRDALVEAGTWPEALPAPRAFGFVLERESVAVLDLPAHDARLDVASEAAIVASLERTLLEAGVDRIAHLREGGAAPAWLGTLAVPSGIDRP